MISRFFPHDRVQQCLVEHFIEVPKILNKDQTLQRTRDQFLDVPVLQTMEDLGEGAVLASQDRIQRRTAVQIADMHIFKVFSQDRV